MSITGYGTRDKVVGQTMILNRQSEQGLKRFTSVLRKLFLLKHFQGFFFGETAVVRISGNLNMANSTSLANRIEAIFDEEEPEQDRLEHRVSPGHRW